VLPDETQTAVLGHPPVTGGCVRLYHGTTRESAESIAERGFHLLDVELVVSQVADLYSIPVDRIWTAASPSFLSSCRAGDPWVYFDSSPHVAALSACIGSEAHFEAVMAVYVVNHPASDLNDPAAWDWAETQLGGHEPAFLIADVPFAELRHLGGVNVPPTMAEWLEEPAWRRGPGTVPLAPPVSRRWIRGVYRAERSWDVELIARRVGIPKRAMRAKVRDGELPPPDQSGPGLEDRWWHSTITGWLDTCG